MICLIKESLIIMDNKLIYKPYIISKLQRWFNACNKKLSIESYVPTSCNLYIFLFILACYFVLILNLSFFIKVFEYFKSAKNFPITHTLSLIPFLMCMFISIFSLLAIKKFTKFIFIFLILISAILSYILVYHGVLFDKTSPIIDTMEHANWQEISMFLTPSFFIYFIILGIIPSVFIYKTRISYPKWQLNLPIRIALVLLYPLMYLVTTLPLSTNYQPIFHSSGLTGKTFFQIIPNNFFANLFEYHYSNFNHDIGYKKIGLDAKVTNSHHALLVVVVGETARGMNFELNGYHRPTNYYSKKAKVISFRNTRACGTCTRVSVPCIFSSLPRKRFINNLADNQDNVLDVLQHAGVNLLWLDNNGNGNCQGVCKNIESIILNEPFDKVLVDNLKTRIAKYKNQDTVIVLHLKGSHGVDYHTKYPAEFSKFMPECKKNEFRLCTQEALINAYDNSLLYTDYVISELIKVLKTQSTFKNSALIYTSDHGESLGENNIHEHCSPYAIAPIEQTNVPLIFWASDALIKENNLSVKCLKKEAYTNQFSHDNLFHSILGIMEVHTEVYQKNLDIFSSCRA